MCAMSNVWLADFLLFGHKTMCGEISDVSFHILVATKHPTTTHKPIVIIHTIRITFCFYTWITKVLPLQHYTCIAHQYNQHHHLRHSSRRRSRYDKTIRFWREVEMRVKYIYGETLIICRRLIYVPIECAMVMVTHTATATTDTKIWRNQ